ncbi:MAG: benzoate/H(+) symporter BenE family transporter [Deinococcales bacterium]
MESVSKADHASTVASTLPILAVFIGVIPVILTSADKLGLAPPQITAWIIAIAGVPGILTLVLALRYRQPLLLTGNLPALVLFASLAGSTSYAELVAAAALAGIAYALASLLGLPRRLADVIPMPVIAGILAGICLPFVIGLFDALGQAPIIMTVTIAAYALASGLGRMGGIALVPAFGAGLGVAALRGQIAAPQLHAFFQIPVATLPHLSLAGTVTVMPMVMVFIALGNVPAAVYLRGQGFRPPERMVGIATGLGTTLTSFLGPTAVCMPFLFTPFTASSQAGPKDKRYRTAVLSAVYLLAIGGLAGTVAALVTVVPTTLLAGLAGLALLGTLVGAVRDVANGPLRLAPVVAFATASSQLSLLGLGHMFWAVALGTACAHLLERRELAAHADPRAPD